MVNFHKHMILKSFVGLLPICFTFALGQDWIQWRGTDRNGISDAKNLRSIWPPGGPPLLWKSTGLGKGFSSLSVSEGRIFTMGDLKEDQYVIALEESNGQILWRTRIGTAWNGEYNGARATPTVDSNRIYSLGTDGTLVSLEATSGRLIWSKNILDDFGAQLMSQRGFAESPLIDGDRVIVTPGGQDSAMVAFNKRSGEVLWKASIPDLGPEGKDGAAYSSIVVSEACGIRQYVQLMGRGLVGIRAQDGQFLWGYNRVANRTANVTTPVVVGNYVFGSTGYRTGSALLQLKCKEEKTFAEEAYFLPGNVLQNHHGGLVLHEGHIYMGTGHRQGFPICVEFISGKVKWGPVRNAGLNSAAISFADGHLYFRYQNGLMILVEANSQTYTEKGQFQIPNVEGPSWSHPVIANGQLLLREQDFLFAYDVSE